MKFTSSRKSSFNLALSLSFISLFFFHEKQETNRTRKIANIKEFHRELVKLFSHKALKVEFFTDGKFETEG